MRLRALYIAAAFTLALAPVANATIVGSTYQFSTSETGNTVIDPAPSAPTTHTDPGNPGFCVGSSIVGPDCSGGSGVSGSFGFGQTSLGNDTIVFTFFGATNGAGSGSFDIDLGHFVTVDGEHITDITFGSGFIGGASVSESFNGTDAIFTFTTDTDFNALGGTSVVFNVTTTPGGVPEPATLALLGIGLAGLGFSRRRKKQ